MRSSRLLVTGLLGLCGVAATAAIAQPAGIPGRRAGQWQMTMSGMGGEGRAMTMSVCVDPAQERSYSPWNSAYAHRGSTGAGSQNHCSKQDVHAIPGGWAFEAVCERPGGTDVTSGRITGDFRNHYHMEFSVKGQGPERHMSIDGQWTGPCAPGGGQTITLPDGRTITVPQR